MNARLTVEQAISMATAAHAGQVDKAGVAYIEHPLAVMALVDGEDEKIVAVLHDVLEDTSTTVEDLRAAGASDRQLEALVSLTRRPNEPYVEAVRRALADPIGRVVKIADHAHNTDPRRLAALPHATAERLRRKYKRVEPLFVEALKAAH